MPARKKSNRARAARTPRGEVTRSRLLEVAHGLFLKRGFHGTSMRQIAQAAGVAVGGIYNHYPSKEKIFAAVLDAYHPYHTILPALETIEGETVEAFLREASRRIYAGVAGAEANLLPLMFIEVVEFQGRHLKQLVEKIAPSLQEFIRRFAQRRGQMRSVPSPVMLRTFMSLLVGFFLSEMLLKDSALFQPGRYDWFGGMVDIYLHGILKPED